MQFIDIRHDIIRQGSIGLLGLALAALVGCLQGETASTTATVAPGGSAALQGPMAFVNNRDSKTLSVVGTDTQGNLRIISTMGATGEFENNVLGDMQVSNGEWVFVNLTAGNKVATIDPLSGATPIHEVNLATGTRPVHIYRDPTDGEVIWSMNDGDATNGDDVGNCPGGGTSVTVLHNSHAGAGGNPPRVVGTTCTLASGHAVTAFSRPTATDPAIPRYAVVTNEKGGQMAFLDNNQTSPTYQMIARLDLCTDAGQAGLNPVGASCDDESGTAPTAPFTANGSKPHGIRWSQRTGKIYSYQEAYKEIIEVDPNLIVRGPGHNQAAITRRLPLANTHYTSYGITPDGRFLLLRGRDIATDPAHVIGKLAVVDLDAIDVSDATRLVLTPLLDLLDVVPSTFKFTPDGQRMYLLASDTATGTGNQLVNQKRNRLFVFNPSTFPFAPPLLAEINLLQASGHNFDVLVQGSGQASAVLVSNGTAGSPGSVSLINANNQITDILPVGLNPGAVMFYYPGMAAAGNQATS